MLNKKKKSSISDEKYFELKYSIQLYVIIFSLIIATASFLGINRYNEISKFIDKDIQSKVSSLDSALIRIDSSLAHIQGFIKNFQIEKEALKTTLLKTGSDAKNIERNINILASKKVNTPNIYIIKDVKVNIKNDKQRFFYNDLRTYDGKYLPKFTKAPFVNIPSNYSIESEMIANTKDYFEISISGYTDDDKTNYNIIDIWLLSDE